MPRLTHNAAIQLLALAAVLLTALVLTACSSITPFVVSGESLDAAGKAFVQVGQTYNRELDAKRVTPEQYRDWAQFARKFQQVYPSAVQLWKSSITVNDAALQKQSSAIVTALVTELSRLGAVVGVQVLGGK